MNWNDLKLFLAIASRKSLGGAAEELNISSTTVFRHLNAFENEVGARLFDRGKGGYELTELGAEMFGLAQNIESSFYEIDRRVAGKDTQPRGKVVLTAPSSFAYWFLPEYLRTFNALYPEITVELLISNQELNMSNRTADLALRVSNNPPENLIGRKVCNIKWGIHGTQQYLAEYGEPVDGGGLTGHRIIGASGNLAMNTAFSWLDRHMPNEIVQRCDDLVTMSYLAANDHGLVLLPDDIQHPALKRCFTLEEAGTNHLWVLTHPDLRKVERIRILMGFLGKALSAEKRFTYG
ncbi:LysR family transcriptional regulator [Kiloniella majae]|uniref:LysR family transcriptional regulator n=1 Tax=Kiloniella majae TaxID=1938558 RepID=UPI000A2788B2|nr:LysR family transcriptional regulator [Kiloniella majae]